MISRANLRTLPFMRAMALTGGIASGKSMVCMWLAELLPSLVIFDCDVVVNRLLEADDEVAAAISKKFGNGALDALGGIDRRFLRNKVFAEESARLALEEI
ncbi:MAG: dephospho-CoA kinase, partial [Armatimonadetes bacterium]|nr:dephospho-CoA kinase [Akkermansiaceae bacterium]